MIERTASCACGKVTLRCLGEPVRVSVCHCLECKRRTGSAFGAQARFPSEQVAITGQTTEFQRVGDSGGVIRFRFCPTCGTTTHYAIDRMPGLVAVALGAFADPTFSPPTVAVYDARRHPWVKVEGVEVHD